MNFARTFVIVLALSGATAARGGGPPLHFVDDPSLGEFVDISDVGQVLFLGEDGEAMLHGAFQGSFIFFPGVTVGQNGGLAFGQATVTDLDPQNQPIPSQGAFLGGQAALAFWDDIDDKDGDILYAVFDDDPGLGDRLIVQWEDRNFDGNGSTLRFQAHLPENLQPAGIYAQFVYQIDGPAQSAGESATIGYQDGLTGYGDLQYSFNETAVIMNGTVLSFIVPVAQDVDADGHVGVNDLLLVLGAWGPCPDCKEPASCPADVDGDCAVDVADLLELLEAWGWIARG